MKLDNYITEITKLCERHKVKKLYAFGSVLTDKFTKNSDIDFIVDFQPFDINLYADNYYALKFSLEDILHHPVDLLEEKAIQNPYFRQVTEQKRKLVYGY